MNTFIYTLHYPSYTIYYILYYHIIGYINTIEGRNIPLDDARDCLVSDLSVLKGATGW